MADRHVSEKRTFTYEGAVALLPEVQRLTQEAHRQVEVLAAEAPADAFERGQLQDRIDAVVRRWAQTLVELGMEVKGLWLVDFDNGSGYYCWRFPEAGLQFFHSYEDGFGGRMRIQ